MVVAPSELRTALVMMTANQSVMMVAVSRGWACCQIQRVTHPALVVQMTSSPTSDAPEAEDGWLSHVIFLIGQNLIQY